MFRVILLALGALLAADTVLASMTSALNLGVFLPALLGLPLLLLGIFYRPALVFFRTVAGRMVKWLLILGYAFFVVSFLLVSLRISGHIADKPAPGADAVIVLGAAVKNDVPSKTLAARLDCAYDYLAISPNTRVIVTGGQGADETRTEASAMKEYLVNKGIEPERIYMEDTSTSTQENLENAKVILEASFKENPRLIVVSSDFHLYRASLVAKRLGLVVETMGNRSIPLLLPNFYLREYVAILGYRALGRL